MPSCSVRQDSDEGDLMNRSVQMHESALSRRAFVGMALAAGACAWMGAFGMQAATAMADTTGADSACPDDLPPLPPVEPDPNDQFGVDKNINMTTIDEWLGRSDVVYRDMRLIFDPARWEDIDEDPYASTVLPGFKMVPYPYLATMAPIPVTEYYEDETLFTCEWSEEGGLLSVKSNYKESLNILRELFPKDKPIFLCCGGAGYASFTKQLLLYMGWDPELVYNVGGMWYYEGDKAIDLIQYGGSADKDMYAIWRADYTLIDFTLLHPESVKYQDKRK